MEENLIYDVGMHDGHDTAHYLDAGYRVVAIEADPALVDAARQRFSGAISSGQLTLLDVAVGPEAGTLPFWISTNPEYNSFSRENASKWGESCHQIEVRVRPFGDILAEYSVPYYLKVDIEGADHYCLEALDPSNLPRFLSFEKDRLEDLLTVRALGYSRFKLIWQENFGQLMYQPEQHPSFSIPQLLWRRLEKIAPHIPGSNRVKHVLSKYKSKFKEPQQHRTQDQINHPYGSSGPFGDKTDGPWRSMDEVAFTWLAFDMGYTGSEDPEWEDWFDVHCAL